MFALNNVGCDIDINKYFCVIAIFTLADLVKITYIATKYQEMHISILDDLKKRFDAS